MERELNILVEAKIGLNFGKRFESQECVDFATKESKCSIMFCDEPCDPHHLVRRKPNGANASDMFIIPLCRKHHSHGPDSIHHLGDIRFEERHKVVLGRLWIDHFHNFMRFHNLDTPTTKS